MFTNFGSSSCLYLLLLVDIVWNFHLEVNMKLMLAKRFREWLSMLLKYSIERKRSYLRNFWGFVNNDKQWLSKMLNGSQSFTQIVIYFKFFERNIFCVSTFPFREENVFVSSIERKYTIMQQGFLEHIGNKIGNLEGKWLIF